jgi:WD40 repeat protein
MLSMFAVSDSFAHVDRAKSERKGNVTKVHDRDAPNNHAASIAAADYALRLHETDAAQLWLSRVPKEAREWEWFYLNHRAHQAEQVLQTGEASIKATALSADGAWLMTADSEKRLKLMRWPDRQVVWQFHDAALTPNALAFHPNQAWVAASFSKHLVKLWDSGTGRELATFQGAGRGITAIAFSPDGKHLASSSWNFQAGKGVWGIVEIWDVATRQLQHSLTYGDKPLVAIAYSPDGKYLAVGSWEVQKTVAVWETATWGEARVLSSEEDGQYKAVQSIVFSPDSQLLAAGGKDAKLRVWDVATGQRKWTFGGRGWGHSKWINSVQFSPDGRFVVSGSTDKTLRIWDLSKGDESAILHQHTQGVNALNLIPQNGGVLSAGGADLVVWSADNFNNKAQQDNWKHPGSVYGLSRMVGKHIFSAAWKGALSEWDSSNGELIRSWSAHEGSANAVSVSANGLRLVSVGNDGQVKLWDRTNIKEQFVAKKVIDTIKGDQLLAVDLSPDGKLCLVAGKPESDGVGVASLWDIEHSKVASTFRQEDGLAMTAMSDDGRWIATGGKKGAVKWWDAKTGKLRKQYAHHSSSISSLRFGKMQGKDVLVVGSTDRSISLVRSDKESPVWKKSAHDLPVASVAISPDGSRIMSTSSDRTIKLWNAQDGRHVLSIPMEVEIYGAQFSTDGEAIFSLPLNGTVTVFRAPKKQGK